MRTALVTGASRGIGLAIARVLAEEGFALTITSRQGDKLAAAAAELEATGAELLAIPGNLADEQAIVEIASRHRERFGRLDVLVNNAGFGYAGPVDEIATKFLDMQLSINLRAMILFYRETLPMLREAGAAGGGLVVNTSSITGKFGTGGLAVYSATKAGIVGFTEAMNQELREAGIKSCVLCPAYVDTELADHVKDRIPAEEMIRVEDLGESVRFLLRLSPQALVPEIMFRGMSEADL